MILGSHEENPGKGLIVEPFTWTRARDSPLRKCKELQTSQRIWKESKRHTFVKGQRTLDVPDGWRFPYLYVPNSWKCNRTKCAERANMEAIVETHSLRRSGLTDQDSRGKRGIRSGGVMRYWRRRKDRKQEGKGVKA